MNRTCTTLTIAAAASIALAGCSSDAAVPAAAAVTTTAATTTATSTSVVATATSAPATATVTATTTAAAPASGQASTVRCSAADITPSLGAVPAPGGQITVPFFYTNSGSAPCTLVGYPGATLQGPDYPTYGPRYQLARSTTGTPTTITLAPGQKAVADLTLGTVATTSTTGWQPTALLTIAPGDTRVMTVPFPAGTPVSRQDGATRPATFVGVFTGPVA